ncbi:MAG: hypothetical protein BRC44_13940 [Cyanobacteria bacterium QS_4_48_99]|nr:MAG: hypothetical protein BRC44_13940 [Cyanobacteria bacterium QS_4_48_99]
MVTKTKLEASNRESAILVVGLEVAKVCFVLLQKTERDRSFVSTELLKTTKKIEDSGVCR